MVSGTEMFVVDPLGPVRRGVGPPWIRLVQHIPKDAQLDRDLENVDVRLMPPALCCATRAVPELPLLCVRAHHPAGGPTHGGMSSVHTGVWMGDVSQVTRDCNRHLSADW